MSNRRLLVTTTLVLIVAVGASVSNAQTVLYVDNDAPLSGDCGDWCTAYKYLQDALSAAQAGNEIRVAEGIYKPDEDEDHPDGTGDRSATFQLSNGVALYGGYRGCPGGSCGSGDDPNERDIETHETILSGDLNGDDVADLPGFLACFSRDGNPYEPGCEPFDADEDGDVDAEDGNIDENSYSVVTASGTDATTELSGFTITAGNAAYYAGGIYAEGGNLSISNCTVTANCAPNGAGMTGFGSSPQITRSRFSYNLAYGEFGGGGMLNADGSGPILVNCIFGGNFAIGFGGGAGMLNNCSSPALINCRFSGNLRKGVDYLAGGGAVANWGVGTVVEFVNCNNSANTTPELSGGGAIWNGSDASTTLTNCILWGDSPDEILDSDLPTTVTYSDIQGGWPGTGNINMDPSFVDPDGADNDPKTWNDNDFRLAPSSPCIDAGDNTAVPADACDLDGDGNTTEQTPIDLDGNIRFYPNHPRVVDMGVYEFGSHPPGIPTVTEWGLLTMTLLVLTGGTLVLIQRRAARV